MTELAIVELTLKALKSNKIPRWQGRAAQGFFYRTLHRIHPFFSETIHDLHKWQPIMPKPFTLSNLLGGRTEQDLKVIQRGDTLYLRLTTLHPHLTHVVLHKVVKLWQREGMSIHDQHFWIQRTLIQRATYESLLMQAEDVDCIEFMFHAPTAFKLTSGRYLAEPAPDYIFNSLFNRWNAFAQEPLPEALHDCIQSRLRIATQETRQHTLKFARGRKGIVPGFYGTVQIAVEEKSSEVRRMLDALAHFAPFSGVGIKSTIGMGQVTYQPEGKGSTATHV